MDHQVVSHCGRILDIPNCKARCDEKALCRRSHLGVPSYMDDHHGVAVHQLFCRKEVGTIPRTPILYGLSRATTFHHLYVPRYTASRHKLTFEHFKYLSSAMLSSSLSRFICYEASDCPKPTDSWSALSSAFRFYLLLPRL